MRQFWKGAVGATVLVAVAASCDAPSTGPVPVATVVIAPGAVVLQSGADTTMMAQVLGPSGAPIAGRVVSWTAGDPAIVTITGAGEVAASLVLGGIARQTTIVASSGGRSGQATITVMPSAVDTLRLAPLGDPLEDGDAVPVVATLTDSLGNILTGRAITWTSRDVAVARVDVNGVVRPTPFLGGGPQSTWIVAAIGALADSIEVSVLPTTIESVTVSPGSPYLAPGWTKQLRGTARTGAGVPLDDVDITWETLDPAVVTVSASGQADAQSLGSGRIVGSVLGYADTVTVTVTSCGAAPGGDYALEVRFVGPAPTAAVQEAFACAAARLRAVIRTSLSSVIFTNENISECVSGQVLNETVPALLILATVEPIDGPGQVLGSAGPCYLRNNDLLPVVGRMRFDSADMQELLDEGSLPSVILHEMLHVVGVGTIWDASLLNLNAGIGATPRFTGPLARAACVDDAGGSTPCANWVPLENCQDLNPQLGCGLGTINSHWKESVFGNELMTGFLDPVANPFSSMSIQALADMGYGVDVQQSNDFMVPGAALRRSSLLAAPTIRMPAPLRPTRLVDALGRSTPILPF